MFRFLRRKRKAEEPAVQPIARIYNTDGRRSVDLDEAGFYNIKREESNLGPSTHIKDHNGRKSPLDLGENSATVTGSNDRYHATININPNGEVYVTDNASTNGTYLDGEMTRSGYPERIPQGEHKLRLGSLELKMDVF